MIFSSDDTTVPSKSKRRIDRLKQKHYNTCESQFLSYVLEICYESGFNERASYPFHAAVCHPYDFRGSASAVL